MPDYIFIEPRTAPLLRDTPINAEILPFEAVPQLGYLYAKFHSHQQSSLYYDPLSSSSRGQVNRLYGRYLTTLSDPPLKLRHNGNTVDMELYVDIYSYVPHGANTARFSPSPSWSPPLSGGNRYERMSSVYVFKEIPVPPASNMIWDGRISKVLGAVASAASGGLGSIASEGALSLLSVGSLVEGIRSQARQAIEAPNQVPFVVLSLGGLGHTVKEPDLNVNVDKYHQILEAFLVEHYNSTGIPAIGNILRNVFLEFPFMSTSALTGAGLLELVYDGPAAVLETYNFSEWVNLKQFQEIAEDVIDVGDDLTNNPIYQKLVGGLTDYVYSLVEEQVDSVVGENIQKLIDPAIDITKTYTKEFLEGL